MYHFNRKSPRAAWHDYRKPGQYFVTICAKKHIHYFGNIKNDMMILNDVGKICNDFIIKLADRKTVNVDEWIVMPNHVHILLVMLQPRRDVSIKRPGWEYTCDKCHEQIGAMDTFRGQINDLSLQEMDEYGGIKLGSIIKFFKGNVTKRCQKNNKPFARQGRYHDHIIRDQTEYNNIKWYIKNNPSKWAKDRFY